MGNYALRVLVAVLAISLVACGNDTADRASGVGAAPALTAATLGEQVVMSIADYGAQSPYADADVDNGASQAQICKACHSLEPGGANMIGPALSGFFGRGVGEQKGFPYSSAVREADFIWTPRALDAWLLRPGQFLPGNSMAFAGVMKKQDRVDLIAFLLRATSDDAADR